MQLKFFFFFVFLVTIVFLVSLLLLLQILPFRSICQGLKLFGCYNGIQTAIYISSRYISCGIIHQLLYWNVKDWYIVSPCDRYSTKISRVFQNLLIWYALWCRVANKLWALYQSHELHTWGYEKYKFSHMLKGMEKWSRYRYLVFNP